MFLRINFSGSFHSLPSPFPHSSSTGRIHCCYGLFPFPFSLILPTFSLIPHMRVKLLCNMGFYYFSVAFFLLLLQCCTTYSARERERDLGDGCWSFWRQNCEALFVVVLSFWVICLVDGWLTLAHDVRFVFKVLKREITFWYF